jgi:hypothetical protein
MLGSPSRLLLPIRRVAKGAILERRLIRKSPVRKALACSSSTRTAPGSLSRRSAVCESAVLETRCACTLPFLRSCRVCKRAICESRIVLLLLRLLRRGGLLLLLAAGASCVVEEEVREWEEVRGLK